MQVGEERAKLQRQLLENPEQAAQHNSGIMGSGVGFTVRRLAGSSSGWYSHIYHLPPSPPLVPSRVQAASWGSNALPATTLDKYALEDDDDSSHSHRE